jgi:hypothetical protein
MLEGGTPMRRRPKRQRPIPPAASAQPPADPRSRT